MSLLKLKALGDAARQEQPPVVAVAFDDTGAEVFQGAISYASGGFLGIRRTDTGEVEEWPMELVRLELAN